MIACLHFYAQQQQNFVVSTKEGVTVDYTTEHTKRHWPKQEGENACPYNRNNLPQRLQNQHG